MFARAIVACVFVGSATAVAAQNPDSLFRLGVAAYRAERFDDAVDRFRRAIEVNDHKAVYHVWLGYAYDALRARANVFRMPGFAFKARDAWLRAIALDSSNVDAHVGLGTKYLYMPGIAGGSMDKARAEADVIRRLNPYRGALFDAELSEHTGDDAQARRQLGELRSAYPDSSAPILRIAQLHVRRGHADSAVSLLEERLAHAPNDSLARQALARIR